jgi:hypothetical protein
MFIMFRYACKFGLKVVFRSDRTSRYRLERSADWIKSKNPNAPAARSGASGRPQKARRLNP